jgi:signal transduction histidine kinase
MRRLSLRWKLSLGFAAIGILTALAVALIVRATNDSDFNQFVVEGARREFTQAVSDYYVTTGGWAGIERALGGPPGNGPHGRGRGGLFGLADAQGRLVLPLGPEQRSGDLLSERALALGQPVIVDGVTVGTILTADRRPGFSPEEQAYLDRLNRAVLLASGGAVLVALLAGLLLARTLTRPLQALTAAAHRMAAGQLDQEVPVTTTDEVGEMAAAFNTMSRAVAEANAARQQMTADVAHELRTPLTVIGGYIEALRDGDLQPTPQRFETLHTEIEHLQTLVDDLRILSQADAGELSLQRVPTDVGELLAQTQAAFSLRAGQQQIALVCRVDPSLVPLALDGTRMLQVLANLVSNAVRHTPAGGTITLSAGRSGDETLIQVRDTGEGIAPDALPRIFDRLYRADAARTGEGGESGLGLSIARAIVSAHGGTLTVDSTLGTGTIFTIRLPAGPR